MNPMDEIVPNLWLGGLLAAQDTATLKAHNIFSILSAMRGKISIHETFIKHQILLDDTEEEDVLVHLMPAISFIQAELDKGRGVLVHCHAGVSRSATIVAAYLMYSRRIDPEEALNMIRDLRPEVDPNPGFLIQLEIFHNAAYKISRRDKTTRLFYMERAMEEVMNGDGTLPTTDMFARLPPSLPHSAHNPSSTSTPITSTPSTPLPIPRRRIRCKMCRQELATREHMLDHGPGVVGPSTPASMTPAGSRRGSSSLPQSNPGSKSRHGSMNLAMTPANANPNSNPHVNAHTGAPGQPRSRLDSRSGSTSSPRPRRPSGLSNLLAAGGLAGLTMSSITTKDGDDSAVVDDESSSSSSGEEGDEEAMDVDGSKTARPKDMFSPPLTAKPKARRLSRGALDDDGDQEVDVEHLEELEKAKDLGRRMSDSIHAGTSSSSASTSTTTVTSPFTDGKGSSLASSFTSVGSGSESGVKDLSEDPNKNTDVNTSSSLPCASPPGDLAAQLRANPKLAAVASPSSGGNGGVEKRRALSITSGPGGVEKVVEIEATSTSSPIAATASTGTGSLSREPSTNAGGGIGFWSTRSPPILINPKCSGYFVEPMKWMEPFLSSGALAGKIICPNKKCGTKLGNYDWAGVCCGCKDWVVPGFCISRSKVDEVV
ncbi:tyrosine protein phosphatase yvh1 [Stygiomarasmius scandens]|uniref:protein-tyrosine-phosphatase n=1 Tax=Marasmiellus scandens TaxID=2682957 RepID=A0ABR1IU67_9AGAR